VIFTGFEEKRKGASVTALRGSTRGFEKDMAVKVLAFRLQKDIV